MRRVLHPAEVRWLLFWLTIAIGFAVLQLFAGWPQ